MIVRQNRNRYALVISLCVLLLAACSGTSEPTLPATAAPIVATATATTAAEQPSPTAVPVVPTDTAAPAIPPVEVLDVAAPPTVTATDVDLSLVADKVFLYPVPTLYAGDLVTFQFVTHVPPMINPADVMVHIFVNDKLIVQDRIGGRNLGGDSIGLYTWAWDTAGQPGQQTVRILIDPEDRLQIGDENPDNNEVVQIVDIQPAQALPRDEQGAEWVSQETTYTTVHVVSGTAAHRDLRQLTALTDEAFTAVIAKLGVTPQRRYDVYFIDRVIGQGGYAGNSIVISYLDRNYAGGGLREVLVHEAAHILDQQIAPRDVTFLREGLAVWVAGGHYKPENLDVRAAALLQIDAYVPLSQLIDQFYPVQHEIGYLQAAALVNYLVNEYGWERVRDFYSHVSVDGYSSASAAIDAGMQAYFGKPLLQVEQDWLAFLSQQRVDADSVADLRVTIQFYNVMRTYQQKYDPTAHFLTAWLPSTLEMRQRGIIADVTRHPHDEMNIVLETMLYAADTALRTGDYNQARVLVDSVSRVLETGSIIDPLATSYLDIVRQATNVGFVVHQIEMTGNQATAYVTSIYRDYLTPINFARTQRAWVMLN